MFPLQAAKPNPSALSLLELSSQGLPLVFLLPSWTFCLLRLLFLSHPIYADSTQFITRSSWLSSALPGRIIQMHGVYSLLNVADSQISVSNLSTVLLRSVSTCLVDLSMWICSRSHKLNKSQTEFCNIFYPHPPPSAPCLLLKGQLSHPDLSFSDPSFVQLHHTLAP